MTITSISEKALRLVAVQTAREKNRRAKQITYKLRLGSDGTASLLVEFVRPPRRGSGEVFDRSDSVAVAI